MPETFGQMGYGYFRLILRELELDDIRISFPAAAIQATYANLQTDPDKRERPFDPWDFMPVFGFELKEGERPVRVATPEELSAFLGAVKCPTKQQ